MSSVHDGFYQQAVLLKTLLNTDPAEAIKQASAISLDGPEPERFNLMVLRAGILVDGGAMTRQSEAIEAGITLFRELQSLFPSPDITYNLANGLVAALGAPPHGPSRLDHQEQTRDRRAEARRCFWAVAQDPNAAPSLRTRAWTNLANQFSSSFRIFEAHDAWLDALKIDPENGVAASSAALNLLWLYARGGCSELTRIEALMLAKIAHRNHDRVVEYAGAQAARQIAAFANALKEPPRRSQHKDPFFNWVERERLALSPSVELVDPELGKLDWLVLPGILERESDTNGMPPPIFAMFNSLKSDFILARDLIWRSNDENAWPATGRFGDTLDYASYGPDTSALVLAHRTALDLLDKVAVAANYYFELGQPPDKVYFGKVWRQRGNQKTNAPPLTEAVEKVVRAGVEALYGLVELADDYDNNAGILRSQKDLRNAGTHRFVVLHDLGDPRHSRKALEIERYQREHFAEEALRALRIARSAIQMLALAISQYEEYLNQKMTGTIGSIDVPDHDWIRGREG